MMKISTAIGHSFKQVGARDHQEDSRFPDSNTSQAGQKFFVICDGVGGSEKGEVASGIVASTIGKQMSKYNLQQEFTDAQLLETLDEAYIALDSAVDGTNDDMGTTMTLVCLHGKGCTMAHIGDSRIYHVRPGEGILYRSDDHSLVNQMVHSGQLTPEQAINHPQSNVITRCMSPTENDQRRSMATVFHTSNIKAGDYLFLCTDGVLHCITDEYLVKLLESSDVDEKKSNIMANRCKDSSDNNTAWLVRIESIEESEHYENEDIITEPNETITDTVPSKKSAMSMTEIESVKRGKKSLIAKIRSIFN